MTLWRIITAFWLLCFSFVLVGFSYGGVLRHIGFVVGLLALWVLV